MRTRLNTGRNSRWQDLHKVRELRERWNLKDKWKSRAFLESFAVIAVLALFFYRSFIALLLLSPMLYPVMKRRMRIQKQKRKQSLVVSFREVMNSVLTSMKAGYSAENAFREAYSDMVLLYGAASPIAEELYRIRTGLDSNIPIEKLLFTFAERCDVEEITEFSEVFAIARRSGGNMTEILERTAVLIRTRLETEEEINVLISAKKMEQKIMDVVPFLIILYIGMSSKGFFDTLYHNPAGIAVMTACMAVYLAAFTISEKIVEIKV